MSTEHPGERRNVVSLDAWRKSKEQKGGTTPETRRAPQMAETERAALREMADSVITELSAPETLMADFKSHWYVPNDHDAVLTDEAATREMAAEMKSARGVMNLFAFRDLKDILKRYREGGLSKPSGIMALIAAESIKELLDDPDVSRSGA